MTELQKEAVEAAEKLNTQLKKYDRVGFVVELASQSVYIHLWVSFFDLVEIKISIYDSRDDDRIFYPKLNREEKLTALLRRKFREIKKDLNKIKI